MTLTFDEFEQKMRLPQVFLPVVTQLLFGKIEGVPQPNVQLLKDILDAARKSSVDSPRCKEKIKALWDENLQNFNEGEKKALVEYFERLIAAQA